MRFCKSPRRRGVISVGSAGKILSTLNASSRTTPLQPDLPAYRKLSNFMLEEDEKKKGAGKFTPDLCKRRVRKFFGRMCMARAGALNKLPFGPHASEQCPRNATKRKLILLFIYRNGSPLLHRNCAVSLCAAFFLAFILFRFPFGLFFIAVIYRVNSRIILIVDVMFGVRGFQLTLSTKRVIDTPKVGRECCA